MKAAVERMLIEDEDIIGMVQSLREQGYNLDITDSNNWALSSAQILQEDPELNYKPINKAMLPPFFVRYMIEYNLKKDQNSPESLFM